MSLFEDDDLEPPETPQQKALRELREKRLGGRRKTADGGRLRFLLAFVFIALGFAWWFGWIDLDRLDDWSSW